MPGFVARMDEGGLSAMHWILCKLLTHDLPLRELANGLLPGIIALCCRIRQHKAAVSTACCHRVPGQ